MQSRLQHLLVFAICIATLAGCATTSVVTRPPRFTGAADSAEGLVLYHDGLPGDRLVVSAEGSSWGQSDGVPYDKSSSITAGTALRTKVIKNQMIVGQNPDWDVSYQIRSASEVTIGTPEVEIGTIVLDGKTCKLRVRIVEPQEDEG